MKFTGRILLGLAAVFAPAALGAQGIPLGSEFQANTYSTGDQNNPVVASLGGGSFVVVWSSGPDGASGLFARRYDGAGAPAGSEFSVDSGSHPPQRVPSVAADGAGGFVVAWGDADYPNSRGQRFDSTGAKAGSEFSVPRSEPQVAADAAGDAVLLSRQLDPSNPGRHGNLVGQRFDGSGAAVGSEFLVSGYTLAGGPPGYATTYYPHGRSIAMSSGGDFVVVWDVLYSTYPIGGHPQTSPALGVFGQRFGKTGTKLGPVFPIHTDTSTHGIDPAVALDPLGNFVVVWSSLVQDGDARGIRGQRFDGSGAKVGPEFQVNTYTTGNQVSPSVAVDPAGDFVVVWGSDGEDGSSSGVFGARFDRRGNRLGDEFPINVTTTGSQDLPRVAADGRGFVAVWESADQDGSGFGVFGSRQNLHSETIAVDGTSATGTSSNANGVLEPGETVLVVPRWSNATDAPIDVSGSSPAAPCAPGTACVAPTDGSADYGTIAAGAVADCADGSPGACYQVSATGPRPGTHWDGSFVENLSPGGGEVWTLHVGGSFSDVPRSQPFYKKIETLLHTGITSGCTPTTFCPGTVVSRDQMAIFVAKGIAGLGELVPSSGLVGSAAYGCGSGGTSLFTDVAPTDSFCKHVHYLAAQNVTLGCNGTQYCPGQAVTRDAMASFIAKAVVAPGGGAAVPMTYSDAITGLSYSCDAGSPSLHFTDVPASSTFCKHIHYLWSRGIVSGCTATTYCPGQPVTRDAMAKFIANGFGLQLYGRSIKPAVTASNTAPTIHAGADQAVTQTGASTAVGLSGSASDDGLPNPPATLTHQWTQVSGPTITFNDATALSTTAHFPQAALYVLRLSASDGLLSSFDDVTINVNPTGGVPADPGNTAPPLDPGVATDVATSTAFLYTGPDPIQTGVADGTIDPRRSAVVRGRVLTREGTPLSGVKITILQHVELGQTLSRADGLFDMAVNGGGTLTLRYEKTGVLPAQRQVTVPWGDFAFLPDVSLVPADSRVTLIDLASPAAFQVARGNPVTDADGTRQATVLFAAGTTAGLVQANGSTVPATQLHVRLTEYTVGPTGSNAMPGDLPPTSGYTYATELGVDESVAKVDGRDVVFNKPVFVYLENFTHIPVGEVVPVGYYDRSRSAWVGSQNGKVIKILGATAGLASLDLDGNGSADGAAALAALGITDAERQQLASLYPAGTSLWRTPVDHFSTIDCNWPVKCPGPCAPPSASQGGPPNSCQGSADGSIIGCDRQTLGERVELSGTPFSLHYQSDRVPGRTAEQSLLLALGSPGVPDGVEETQLEVLVAGQKLAQSVPATTTGTTVTWDGKDAYGRPAQGSQRVTVRLGYTYKVVYAKAVAARMAWAQLSGVPLTGNPARMEVTLWQEWTGTITRWDSRGLGLGGWSLSALHAYDPVGRVLHLGDGTRRDAQSLGAGVIRTYVGTLGGFSGDAGPASLARISGPNGLAIGPDGSLYIADSGNSRIRRVDPDGIISTVAGNGTSGDTGDGGLATLAELSTPIDVALGLDGSLYIAEQTSFRVRKVDPAGVISTVAGNGQYQFSGDGGPATLAGMEPYGVAVALDGSLYIADRANSRIRMVDPGGVVHTVAGISASGFAGDGGPADQARLSSPNGVTFGADGSLFIVDRGNFRIRRVDPQGIIRTVAGSGQYGFSGDGGPAQSAKIASPSRVGVGPDGTLYIPDFDNNRIRSVGSEGIIGTMAGTGVSGLAGDLGLAPQAKLSGPSAIAVGPDGAVYLADFYNHRIRRIASALPGVSASDVLIPSSDGQELYVFSGAGRHLRTLDALTGALRAQFAYDSANRLVSVDDGDGNITTVQRDSTTGDPTAIVAPFGQQTTLTLDANGYLASIADPANETFQLTSTATGLLKQLTDPRGGIHKFTYDAVGRLTKDEDPAGGFKTLARSETPNGSTTSVSTGLGRTTTYLSELLVGGAQHRVTTEPSGAVTEVVTNADGSWQTTYPSGTVVVVVPGPDPRWGMQAPILVSSTITTPGALVETITGSRTATLADAADPLSLLTQTDKRSVNGRTWTTVYTTATKALVRTSPVGRAVTSTLDARGRVAQQQVAGLLAETFTYDGHGRLSTAVQGTGSTARTTTLSYDSDGLLETLTDPLAQASSFAYDSVGRMTSETLPGARTVAFGYDASGNLTSLTPPGAAAHAFGYTSVDLDASVTPPALPGGPTPTTFTHDIDRGLTRVTRPDGVHVDVAYDTSGRPGTVTLPAGAITFGYDAANRLASTSAPSTVGLAYAYDGDLLTSGTWSGPVAGSVAGSYDTTFRIASLRVNGVSPISFGYDNDDFMTAAGALTLTWHAQTGLLTGTTLGVVTDARTHNGFGEPATRVASISGTPQWSQTYTRDKLGRVTTLAETIGGGSDTYDYAYDAAGRLTGVQKNAATIETYTYDANDNRLSFTGTGGPQLASYDVQDRLTSYRGNTYTYSKAGELQAKGAGASMTSYSYDPLGNLLAVTLPNGTAIAYVVDGRQRRVGKKVNGTLVQGFLYQDDLRPVAEVNGAGAVVRRFVYDTTNDNVPASMVQGGVTYRILTDPIGSVRLVVNTASGQIVQQMDYDGFGQVVNDTSPGFQPFGFAGGLYDRDTKLVRFGARDYDPELGRFAVKDPILFAGGQANLYAYAGNDPVNANDVDGLGGSKSRSKMINIPKNPPRKAPKQPAPQKQETTTPPPSDPPVPCPTTPPPGPPPPPNPFDPNRPKKDPTKTDSKDLRTIFG